ncbi:MAG: O-antigen ligase family protein [Candidatus Magnetominusculus sp. LBB02]|nr:O-antigen ligase family protein [Candidatus Magnetominusculus sp. LBB02]
MKGAIGRDHLLWAAALIYLACNAAVCALYPFYIVLSVNALLLSCLVFCIKPMWGVYLLIFLVPVARDNIYVAIGSQWNFKVNDAYTNLFPVFTPFFLFTCAGFLMHKGASLWPTEIRNPARPFLILIALYAAFTLFWSKNILSGIFQYYYLISNIMLLVIVVAAADTEQSNKKLMWLTALSCLIQSVLSYCFRFVQTTIVEHDFIGNSVWGIRNYGGILSVDDSPIQAHGLQEAHETSMLMNIFMGVSAGLFLTEKSPKRKIFIALCFLTGLSVLIGTESRGAAAAFVAMGMFFIFLYQKTSKRLVRSAIVFLAALLAFYAVEQKVFSVMAGKEETIMRLLRLGQETVATGDVLDPGLSQKSGSGPGRKTIWGIGFSGLADGTWPVGLGIGNYKFTYKTPHSHSLMFSFLFDFGLVGLVLFLLIVYVIIKSYLKIYKFQNTYLEVMSLCLMSALVAVAFQGCFDFDYTYPIFWLFGGLLFSTLLLANKRSPQL